jgi:Leucine-rich repeat (LRR) protein
MLSVSNNLLTALPDTIGNLTTLKKLDLCRNRLTTLTDTIGRLTSLRELYASHNQLMVLPDTIGNLAFLRRLYVINNQLTTLPDTIGNLTSLRQLYIDHNLSLPTSIRHLHNLSAEWDEIRKKMNDKVRSSLMGLAALVILQNRAGYQLKPEYIPGELITYIINL